MQISKNVKTAILKVKIFQIRKFNQIPYMVLIYHAGTSQVM